MVLRRSQAKYGSQFNGRHQTRELLGLTCIGLGKWDEVEELAHSDFKGSDKIMAIIVSAYCRQGKWDKADKILDEQFEGRDMTIENLAIEFCRESLLDGAERLLQRQFKGKEKVVAMLADLYCRQGKWFEAETLCLEVDEKTSNDCRGLEAIHAFAAFFFSQQEFNKSEFWCHRAAKGREKLLGKDNVLYCLSINLLVQIYEAQGKLAQAEAFKEVLPSGVEGISPMSATFDELKSVTKFTKC